EECSSEHPVGRDNAYDALLTCCVARQNEPSVRARRSGVASSDTPPTLHSRRNERSSFLLGSDQHHHLPPFHLRHLLDLSIRRQVLLHTIQQLATDVLMHHFATAET